MMEENSEHGDISKIARRREQNRRGVARYRKRHGDVHRAKWAAYMRGYRARQTLLRHQQQEENQHEHRNSGRHSRRRQNNGNNQAGSRSGHSK